MAGNTKLMGFGSGNKVTLSRWGKKANVTLSEDSWERLLYVCKRMLPTEPKKQPERDGMHFFVKYHESTGRIGVVLDLGPARELYTMLRSKMDTVADQDYHKEDLHKWAQAIDEAIRAHHDYHNLDEPGVR